MKRIIMVLLLALAFTAVLYSPLIDQSLKYLYGADEAYLQAFFDEMESRFGSFQAFVHEALHLKDEDIMRLGNLYLS